MVPKPGSELAAVRLDKVIVVVVAEQNVNCWRPSAGWVFIGQLQSRRDVLENVCREGGATDLPGDGGDYGRRNDVAPAIHKLHGKICSGGRHLLDVVAAKCRDGQRLLWGRLQLQLVCQLCGDISSVTAGVKQNACRRWRYSVTVAWVGNLSSHWLHANGFLSGGEVGRLRWCWHGLGIVLLWLTWPMAQAAVMLAMFTLTIITSARRPAVGKLVAGTRAVGAFVQGLQTFAAIFDHARWRTISAGQKSRTESRMTLPCADRSLSQDRTVFFSPQISGMVLFFFLSRVVDLHVWSLSTETLRWR